MLNIGKLRAGGAEYYLATVASSVEAYYTGAGEAPGRWVGGASRRLGLSGLVTPETLRTVLAGQHPDGGSALVGAGRTVPGFDLTFRAPKSVSLLWALADERTAGEVRDAHDVAVLAALDYLERHAAFTRRGKGGAERIAAEGLVAAAFRHRTSRADDPLLHTHVLVANWPTRATTAAGAASMADSCTSTPRPPATCIRPSCAPNSPSGSALGSARSPTATPISPVSRER